MAQYLRLYIDHPKVGCGFRFYLVLRMGPKWARLFLPESATTITIPRRSADEAIARGLAQEFKPGRLAKRIKEAARSYAAEDEAGVREALALLRQAKASNRKVNVAQNP